MNSVFLKRNHHKRLLQGHLWIFSNELIDVPKYQAGEIVEVFYENQSFGYSFFNPNSLISCRLLKSNNSDIKELLIERISKAKTIRETLIHSNNYRLIYGESDFLPGVIIDKYEEYFVVQILSYGFEVRKEEIKNALLEVFPKTKGIIHRANSKLREIEGLPDTDEILFGKIPESINIDDNGIKLSVNLSSGQKTGYFLDQVQNRHFLRKIANNKSVLDCYCNIGGFGLNALKGGASEVTFVDVSDSAIHYTKVNLKLNNYENYNLFAKDVFDFLPELISKSNKYDIVVLDPPAFAKSKKSIYAAESGYAKLNKLGIKLLSNNGYLITSSCSHYIEEAKFIEIVSKELAKSGRKARLIHRAGHSADHPIHPSMPETEYLKFLVFFVE